MYLDAGAGSTMRIVFSHTRFMYNKNEVAANFANGGGAILLAGAGLKSITFNGVSGGRPFTST